MKKAEEYIKNYWGFIKDGVDSFGRRVREHNIKLVIQQAQKEAIEETVKQCAQVAELEEFIKTPQDRNSISNDMGDIYAVNKEIILQVADELKKELGL